MNIFDIVGWAGTLCILASYFLLVAGHRLGQGVSYMTINLGGSILMVINVIYNRAWPAVALQSAFILISVWGIVRSMVRRPATDTCPTPAPEKLHGSGHGAAQATAHDK